MSAGIAIAFPQVGLAEERIARRLAVMGLERLKALVVTSLFVQN
jgi:hypothetical protein